MMTTYFWMLCEGVFLWVLLARSPGEEEESLSIINESDFSPLTRSFLSQLTTPMATPLLSPQTPSPRSSWSAGRQILLKPNIFLHRLV